MPDHDDGPQSRPAMVQHTRIYLLPIELLASILTPGTKVVQIIECLPAGSEIIRHSVQAFPDQLAICVEHDSFEPIPAGAVLPAFEIKGGIRS